jgi:hypothetical protein
VQVPEPVSDCTLSAAPGETGTAQCGAPDLRVGGYGGSERRALLDFDVVGQLPAHATVLESYVAMYVDGQQNTAWDDWTMHAATRPWVNGEASWLQAGAGTAWTSPGGDFSPVAAHTKRFGGGLTGWTYWTIPDLAQRWMDRSEPEHGLVVKDADGALSNGLTFASGDGSHPDRRPYLSVYYQPRVGSLPHDSPAFSVFRERATRNPYG